MIMMMIANMFGCVPKIEYKIKYSIKLQESVTETYDTELRRSGSVFGIDFL